MSSYKPGETRHYWIGFPRDCHREAKRLDMYSSKMQIINDSRDMEKLRGVHDPVALHFVEPWYMLPQSEQITERVKETVAKFSILGHKLSRIWHTKNGVVKSYE